MSTYFSGKGILITGGTGSLGSSLALALTERDVKFIKIFDSDENGLFNLKLTSETRLSPEKRNRLRFILGDIKDRERVRSVVKGVDLIYHLAALKHLTLGFYYPLEVVKTNVFGTYNIIQATLDEAFAEKLIFISTDKAVKPTSIYGASKLIGEQLTLNANTESNKTIFAVIRLGNILGTRGAVHYIWGRQSKAGLPLTITDKRMKRFFITMEEAVNFILRATVSLVRGCIMIPKMKEYKILDLAKKFSDDVRIKGRFRGEKLAEILMTEEEKERSEETDWGWIIR